MHRPTDPFKDIYFKEWSTQVWKLSPHDSLPTTLEAQGRGLQSASPNLKPKKQEAGTRPGVSPEPES